MKNRMARGLPLGAVLSAVVAVVALRAGGQTTEATMGARHRVAPVTATADESRRQPAVTTGAYDSAVEQMRHVFHELHAAGRNAHCGVCDSQYQTA